MENPSRWELEWGIRKIRGGLKNQPHRFGGDFEKPPELYCMSALRSAVLNCYSCLSLRKKKEEKKSFPSPIESIP